MKLVIFAGGYGTRLSEETQKIPKPMVEIGGMPIIWHIMKYYSSFGITDFIICLGFKGEIVKNFFLNYNKFNKRISINLKSNLIHNESNTLEDWNVTLIDTGLQTQTGGRLKNVKDLIKNDKYFYLTYGDGLSDININELTEFFIKKNKICTLTAVKPRNRFGILKIDSNNLVNKFEEKPEDEWVNGGFFIMRPEVINLINDDDVPLEQQPMQTLVEKKEICSFKHNGFWQCMDTLNDRNYLEKLWLKGKAPWKIW
jgi:glucose-1-phosphate cytidylyltransferase